MYKLGIITFSKNRPCQLYSQLCSTRDHIHGDFRQIVLMDNRDIRYYFAYNEVQSAFPEVIFRTQINNFNLGDGSFHDETIRAIELIDAEYFMMSTDDSIFIRDFQVEDGCKYTRDYLLSLRLAPHLKIMQTAGMDHPCKTNMPNPEFTRIDNKNCWQWGNGICEWYYPLACDASVFFRYELLQMLKSYKFLTPNSLESGLMKNFYPDDFYFRKGLCYDESIYLNIPWNIVSNEAVNKNANISTDIFQDQWKLGNRINHEKYYEMIPESCHMELNLEFIKR